jgi:hypothetical protein
MKPDGAETPSSIESPEAVLEKHPEVSFSVERGTEKITVHT